MIDSGVQLDHPDLAEQVHTHLNLSGDRTYLGEDHGTAVAGIVAARADNKIGIAGVAPDARVLALRACRQLPSGGASCTTLGLALALSAALDKGAQVINLSLGGPTDRLIARLIDTALARRVAVVAAVDRSADQGGFPAAMAGVVAAIDEPSPSAPIGTLAAPVATCRRPFRGHAGRPCRARRTPPPRQRLARPDDRAASALRPGRPARCHRSCRQGGRSRRCLREPRPRRCPVRMRLRRDASDGIRRPALTCDAACCGAAAS